MLGGDADVAPGGRLQAGGEAVAVDGGDGRLEDVDAARVAHVALGVVGAGPQPVHAPRAQVHLRDHLQVGPGGEGAVAGAG